MFAESAALNLSTTRHSAGHYEIALRTVCDFFRASFGLHWFKNLSRRLTMSLRRPRSVFVRVFG